MLDFRIHTFLAVCKHMNYTRAAEELCITQPAVSQQIKYLENQYNTKLFTYIGKNLSLTPTGEMLFNKATALANDEAQFIKELQSTHQQNPTYTLGVTYTIGEYIINKPIAAFSKKNDKIRLNLSMKNTTDLRQDLIDGNIQFALIEGSIQDDFFESISFSSENFIAVCSKNHEFTQPIHSLSDLTSEHIIIREEGSGTRDIFEKALALNNLSLQNFNDISYIGSMPTIVELIKEDCGISFLYQSAVEEELKNNTIQQIPLTDFNIKHDLTFIYNKGSLNKDIYLEIFKDLQLAYKH